MGYDEEKMRAIYDEEHRKEMKLQKIKDSLLEDVDFFDQVRERAIENDAFLSTIMNSQYDKIEIQKNIEGYIEVKWTIKLPENTIIADLKRKYPYSDVIVTHHDKKILKVEVIEKIRFEK